MNLHTTNHHTHTPVLLQATLDALQPKVGESYLDLTAGYGGHAAEVLAITKAPEKAVLVDRDDFAIKALRKRFATTGASVLHSSMAEAVEQLIKSGQQFDMVMMDLGVSSPQIDNADRGFSFQADGPLDMRMDVSQPVTAASLLNSHSARELTDLLREYGEEPKAKAIATAIVEQRPLTTTRQLADVVHKTTGRRKGKTDPATRTFQALRIAVNNEMGQLDDTLARLSSLITVGGRFVVISFHSLEDRRVKQFMREHAGLTYDAKFRAITKRPIAGTQDVLNPRARSAKLRAAVKINI